MLVKKIVNIVENSNIILWRKRSQNNFVFKEPGRSMLLKSNQTKK